jgi:arsenate reductase
MNNDVIKFYHNPRCSKSRQALKLISSQNITLEIIKYLEEGISKLDLENIFNTLEIDKNNFLRKNEKSFKDLNINLNTISTDQLIKLIIENPIIIQRPLAIKYEKDIFINAIIGRPPEMILNLLN